MLTLQALFKKWCATEIFVAKAPRQMKTGVVARKQIHNEQSWIAFEQYDAQE
jgi:hypothetical protein